MYGVAWAVPQTVKGSQPRFFSQSVDEFSTKAGYKKHNTQIISPNEEADKTHMSPFFKAANTFHSISLPLSIFYSKITPS